MKYYNMMIEYALHQSEYLDAAKYYYKIWETPSVKADENDRGRAVCFTLFIQACGTHTVIGT